MSAPNSLDAVAIDAAADATDMTPAATIAWHQAIIVERDGWIAELERAMTDLRALAEHRAEGIERLERHARWLEEVLAERDVQITELDSRVQCARTVMDHQAADIHRLRDELTEEHRRAWSAEQNASRQSELLDRTLADVNRRDALLDAVRTEATACYGDVRRLESERAELLVRITSLDEERRSLTNTLRSRSERIEQLEQEIAELRGLPRGRDGGEMSIPAIFGIWRRGPAA